MRRYVLLLVALVVMTACGSGSEGDTETTTASDSSSATTTAGESGGDTTAASDDTTESGSSGSDLEAELTMVTWTADATGWVDWWPEMVETFNEEYPNVSVDIEMIAFSDYISSITNRFVAGEGPELVHIPLPLTTLPAWADAGFLEDVGGFAEEIGVTETWPESQASMVWNDTTYGILMQDYGYMLFYNEALLTEAGVEVPTTLEDFLAAAEAATGGETFGYAVTQDNTINFLRDIFMFVEGTGAEWITDGAWNFTSDDVVAAVDSWRTMATEYAPQGTDINQKRQAFFDGNVAMMAEGPFILGQIPDNSPENVAPSLHAAGLPFENVPGDVSNGMSVSAGLDDTEREAALAFVEHIASQESMESLALAVTSPVAMRDANAVLSGTPDIEAVADTAESVTGLLFAAEAQGLRADFSTFESTAVDVLHQLLVSDAPTADVLAELQAQLESEGITP